MLDNVASWMVVVAIGWASLGCDTYSWHISWKSLKGFPGG